MYGEKWADKLLNIQRITRKHVDSLYALSVGSLVMLSVLTTGITIFLYPVLSEKIVFWAISVLGLISCRLYCLYLYQKNPHKYKIELWYLWFVLFAGLTAVLFSSLSLIFFPKLTPYYQLFIIAVLVGLSSGSLTSLSADARLGLIYIAILLLPLIVVLILEKNDLNTFLIMALLLYFFAQLILILKNYHQEKAYENLENKHLFLHKLFEEAPLGIVSYDLDLRIAYCNHYLCEMMGTNCDNIIGLKIDKLPDTRPADFFRKSLYKGSHSRYNGPYHSITDKNLWVDMRAFPFLNDHEEVIGGVVLIEDKSKEHNALNELEYLVEHDVLTALLNRRGFVNYMKGLMEDPLHQNHYSLLYYLDLNQFKSINDTMGHTIGDEVLLAVSKRLVETLPESATVSRLGGDEFIITLPHLEKTRKDVEKNAKDYAEKIEKIFGEPFSIEDMLLHIKASIGIVIIDPKYRDIEELIRHADLTMYEAKHSKKHISYYDETFDHEQKALFQLQHQLSEASSNGELELFFQPIVTIEDDALYAIEMLIRWRHPEKGLLSPDAFIPLAEEIGLLSSMSWWIIEKVCQTLHDWKDKGVWHLNYISINISAQQLIEKDFDRKFLDLLDHYKIKPGELMLEITEQSLIEKFDETQTVINHLRSQGIKCGIDDFGIGYSSLSYLKKLSFHTLKIDREFVRDIENSSDSLLLMKTILEIGKQFGYQIVIEGIENESQKKLLEELDNELIYQGYLYSKPIPTDEFYLKYLKRPL